jgi:murein L,D-transpeptidase YcbB/YkuD
MRGFELDRILAGTALALVLTLSGQANAQANNPAAIEAGVPVPEPANVPPPTAADIAKDATTVTPAAQGTMFETPRAAAPAAAAPATPAPATTATAPATPAPAPVASAPASLDPIFGEKLREILTSRGDRMFSRKGERAGVEAFYRDRNYAPLWVNNGAPTARATEAIAYLRGVDADGLEPSEYPAPDFKATDAAAMAEAELKFTSTVLTFVRHAQNGRVHWSRVSQDIFYNEDSVEPAAVLGGLAGSKTAGESLGSYLPQHALYKALKDKLAEARKQKGDNAPARIGAGPVLKTGKTLVQDERVPALREKLGLAGDKSDITYDKELEDAVAKFQKKHGLPATGSLTTATIEAMNGPRRDRDADIIMANLERWRWMPHELGKTRVVVNIPDYTLRLYRNDQLYWNTRIVVGKPNLPSPIMSASMKFITVNPTWNVPPSIIANEYLPALRSDPDALRRIGLKIEQNPDGTVRIYQPPGDANALGRIRFNFPNKFLVYQHDTPDKNLFAHDKRAYSHGCMRVQDPLMYGEKLLSIVLPNEHYTADRLRKMYGGSEVNIDFPVHIPVHLTYQSAYVDDAGKLVIREDVYGRDAKLISIMKGDERRVADIGVDRAPTGSGISRDALRYNVPGSTDFSNPFAGWFGGPRSQPSVRPSQPVAQPQRPGDRRGGNNRISVRDEPSFIDRIFR